MNPSNPFKLHFYIGGYGNTNQYIKIEDGKLYHATEKYKVEESMVQYGDAKFLPKDELENLKQLLEKIVVYWKPEYHSPMDDGTQWSLEADLADSKIKVVGSNAYPGSDDMQMSAEFKMVFDALMELAE